MAPHPTRAEKTDALYQECGGAEPWCEEWLNWLVISNGSIMIVGNQRFELHRRVYVCIYIYIYAHICIYIYIHINIHKTHKIKMGNVAKTQKCISDMFGISIILVLWIILIFHCLGSHAGVIEFPTLMMKQLNLMSQFNSMQLSHSSHHGSASDTR